MKISDEIRKVSDEYDVLPLYELADRIDREMVELPKDRDGVPIHVGDTVWGCVSGMKLVINELRLTGKWAMTANGGFDPQPLGVTHELPDSFERIARNMEDWAEGYRNSSAKMDFNTVLDFADRIRRLAKEEVRDGD